MPWRPVDQDPLAIVMVGLPARGKTFTARRVQRYLAWQGYRSRLFNVGDYRRQRLGAGQSAAFFDPTDAAASAAREQIAGEAIADLVGWLTQGGEIGVLDATNSRVSRRATIRAACEAAGIQVVFVEIVCTRPEVVERNVRRTKIHSPDYAGRPVEEAVADFLARIAQYERGYEPLSDGEGSFVRITDLGEKVELHRIDGYLPGRLVPFLLHLHDTPRPIHLTRHGQSLFNLEHRVGGDPELADDGLAYAERLADFVRGLSDPPTVVWTSTLRRAVATAKPLGVPTRAWKLLDEIDAGECDGLTYDEIRDTLPREWAARKKDKFRYRYPRGESYRDLIARLEPVVLELERQTEPVLVVAHQAVLRALYSYLAGTPPADCPHLDMPLHTVISLDAGPYGSGERRTLLGP